MKLGRPPLPRLMPRWLVALRADGGSTGYRLRLGWNGRHRLLPAQPPAGAACILVLDSALPFRRRLQRLPATRKARLALLGAAPGEFPLPAEEVHYGMGLRGGEAYLYALPRRVLAQARERGIHPAIVLAADFGAGEEAAAALAAFEAFLDQGAALDLLRERRFLSRRRLLRIELGAALAVALIACGALLLAPSLSASVLEWRVAKLREQGSALPRLYEVTERMAQAQAEAASLYARPEARLPAILAGLFESAPPGHSVRSIELKAGTLRITGTGAGARAWLVPLGFPAERILEQQAGGLQQFSAERPL